MDALDSKTILWAACAALALYFLASLMRARQAKLMGVLRTYVEQQIQWARKRAKATRLAQAAAHQKELQESDLEPEFRGVQQLEESLR